MSVCTSWARTLEKVRFNLHRLKFPDGQHLFNLRGHLRGDLHTWSNQARWRVLYDLPFSILLLESTCGVTSGLGLVNAQPAAVNKILPKLRPAIPAQKPNQPRLWLACASQRWSRKPNNRRAAPDTIYRTTLTGAGEPYHGRGERAGILPVRMQNEHRVTNIIAARGNKFVAPPVNESIEPIVSPLILSPPIRPKKINAEAEKQFADAPENLSPPRLKRHSGIQCFLCLNQAKPFVNQFFPDFIQRLF